MNLRGLTLSQLCTNIEAFHQLLQLSDENYLPSDIGLQADEVHNLHSGREIRRKNDFKLIEKELDLQ
jgi:hypothetical protein